MENNQASFSSWAKVEVMGHQSHVGFVTTEAYGATILFRVDSPEIPEAEEELTSSEYIGEHYCRPGSIVRRAKIAAASVLLGAGSIYRITPCDEATAYQAVRNSARRPLFLVRAAGVASFRLPAPPETEKDEYYESLLVILNSDEPTHPPAPAPVPIQSR